MADELKPQELFEQFKAKQAEIDTFLQKSAEELKGTDAVAKDAILKAEKAAADLQGQADRLLDIEQKLADRVTKGKDAPKSLGQFVIESDSFKAYAKGETSRARFETKNTITGQAGSPPQNSNILVPQQRLPGIIPGAFRMLRIRDVIPSGVTTSNAVEYTRELAFTNAAAETAEGAQKPETDLTFELVTAPVRTIAHFLKLSKQVLDDAPALASYVDTRLRYGVELRTDNQLLKGNGTGQNISGMMNAGNFTAFTPSTGDTQLDTLNRAIYAVWGADYAPTAIILNPADWGAIERIKGDDEHYIVGNPQGTIGPVLWGLPVVVSNAMDPGKFLLGAMDIAYQVWDRQSVVVEMFEQDGDNAQKNLVTVRAEERLALATYRPASVRSGNLKL